MSTSIRSALTTVADPVTCGEPETGPTFRGYLSYRPGNAARIATLGPVGTSSEDAAMHLLQVLTDGDGVGATVDLYATFEDAAEATLLGYDDVVVVANAYHDINEVYMRRDLTLVGVYIHETPDYGLAVRPGEHVTGEQAVPSHPAPIPLLRHLRIPGLSIVAVHEVSSTSDAARLVADGTYNIGLTNKRAVDEYGLEFASDTHSIRMSWAVFAPCREVVSGPSTSS